MRIRHIKPLGFWVVLYLDKNRNILKLVEFEYVQHHFFWIQRILSYQNQCSLESKTLIHFIATTGNVSKIHYNPLEHPKKQDNGEWCDVNESFKRSWLILDSLEEIKHIQSYPYIPSGKRSHHYGTSPFFIGPAVAMWPPSPSKLRVPRWCTRCNG